MEIDVKAGGTLAYLNYDGKPGQPMGKGVTQVAATTPQLTIVSAAALGTRAALVIVYVVVDVCVCVANLVAV